MKYFFIASSKVELSVTADGKNSNLDAIKFNLKVSDNLDKSRYLKDNLPHKDGLKATSVAFVQGLIGNIKLAHKQGVWDEVRHIEWIIAELGKGFATIAEVKEDNDKF